MKDILLDIIEVWPQKDKTLLLVFENRQKKVFDMKPYLQKKPYGRLKSESFFKRARVENGTVAWPDEIDIAPETLWNKSVFL